MKLSPRQQRFVSEFLIDMNGSRAVRAAGYSNRGDSVQAARLLRNATIRKAIEERRRAAEECLEIKRTDILRGFMMAAQMAKANSDPRSLVAALREIARMQGFYDPRHRQEVIPTGDADRLRRHLAVLSDRQLRELASGG